MTGAGGYVLALVLPLGAAIAGAATVPRYRIDSVAGTNNVGDGGAALQAMLGDAQGIAVDPQGNIYVADALDHRIRKIAVNGRISTIAGNGHPGFEGDGGPSVLALLNAPYGVALDAAGNLYVADLGNQRVRRIATDGAIQTVAGGGQSRNASETGNALATRFLGPRNVAADSFGNLYISDFGDHRVFRLSPAGQISPAAGTGVAGYSGEGTAVSSRLSSPAGLAVDRAGALYIADSGNNRIRRVFGGSISTALGGDARIALDRPTGLAFDGAGNLYVADSGHRRVLKLTPDGRVALVTAHGAQTTAGVVSLGDVRDVAADSFGNLFVADGRRVQFVSPGGTLPMAGTGAYAVAVDLAPATESYLSGPIGVAVDGADNLYIADENNYRVRRVGADGRIRSLAGSGRSGFSGDGGLATSGSLVDPVAVVVDLAGGVYIADHLGHRIRRVSPGGFLSTIAGNGAPGHRSEPSAAVDNQVSRPRGMAIDGSGALFIADSANHRVRRIAGGVVTTFAGSGVRGYGGDGRLAIAAQLDSPSAVALDADGALYIADRDNHAVRRVGRDGVITTVAGTGVRGFSGDLGPAALARLSFPTGVAVDAAGALFIADSDNHRIRRVDADGVIDTVAGSGVAGFQGDGGPALSARLRFPSSVAVASDGSVLVADLDNNRVRRLTPTNIPAPVEQVEPVTVLHGASFQTGAVAPGEIVSLFGRGFGPKEGFGGRMTTTGFLQSTIEETEVRFDGAPAALFYVQETQINAQVPYAVAGKRQASLEVLYRGVVRGRATVDVAESAPGIFTAGRGAGQAVVVNEDGSLNSPENPAARGSIVVVYATGEGQTDPGGLDGKAATAPLPRPLLPVELRIGGLIAQLQYAGAAPGFVGLMQLNARVPGPFAPTGVLALELRVGAAVSQPGVSIAIK